MDETTDAVWQDAFADRLQRQWPRVAAEDTAEVAREVAADRRWRGLAPDRAAAEWIGQGIPDAAR